MGTSLTRAKQSMAKKANFLGKADSKNKLRIVFEEDFSEEQKYQELKAYIESNETLRESCGGISLPDKYTDMLEADGFFDVISEEDASKLHEHLAAMLEIPVVL